MDLYVLRHAKAERAAPDDASRPLTQKGQRDARRLGRWMRDRELRLDLVATSSLVRAQETVSLVLQGAGTPPPVETWEELEPGGTVDGVLARLAVLDPDRAVLVVGHEPLLSALVSAAIGGGRIRLAKGALVKVGEMAPEVGGELDWLVTPAMITPGP
jgi:phosphohistidine phosphatase